MNIFGQFYGRDGTESINIIIEDDKIKQLVDARAESEEKFEDVAGAMTDDSLDEDIGTYSATEIIINMVTEGKEIKMPFSMIEEEFTYGCAATEDEARIQFTKEDGEY